MPKTKKLALMALLTAIALTIFVVENQLPAPVPVPGVKLGLANIITLVTMLLLGKKDVKRVLEDCGASDEKISAFDDKYDSAFGEKTELSPANIIDARQFEVKTPDVTIKVKPDKSYLLETRMIDGVKYVLVRAEEGVEVNGVGIRFPKPEEADKTAE